MSKNIALIDADILAYRSGFAVEQKVVSEEIIDGETWTSVTYDIEPLDNALQIVKDTIDFILLSLNTDQYELYLSGDENFRKDIATIKEYKGNRKKSRKPVHLEDIRQYLINERGAKVSDGQEADDDLGIRQMQLGEQGVITSIDKDLLMIPGKHYNWVKDKKAITNEHQSMLYFFRQLLTGDATDNIPGCPTIGPQRAAKALKGIKTPEDMYQVVYDLYDDKMKGYAHKIVPEMVYNDGKVCYNHWNSNEEIQCTIDDYISEIASLIWIRRKEGEFNVNEFN